MSNVMQELLASKSDGDGEDLNLLAPHLVVTVMTRRQVLVDGTTDEAVDDPEPYVGSRFGVGQQLVFRNYGDAAAWFQSQADTNDDKVLKVQLNREDDQGRYAAALAEGNDGSGQ